METLVFFTFVGVIALFWGFISLRSEVKRIVRAMGDRRKPKVFVSFKYLDRRDGSGQSKTVRVPMEEWLRVNDWINVQDTFATKYGVPYGAYIVRHCHYYMDEAEWRIHAERQEVGV